MTFDRTPDWAIALFGDNVVSAPRRRRGDLENDHRSRGPPFPGRLVARYDSGTGPLSGTPFTLAREAATYAAVADAGIPVPALVAVAAGGRAFVVELVDGHGAGIGGFHGVVSLELRRRCARRNGS